MRWFRHRLRLGEGRISIRAGQYDSSILNQTRQDETMSHSNPRQISINGIPICAKCGYVCDLHAACGHYCWCQCDWNRKKMGRTSGAQSESAHQIEWRWASVVGC